MPRSASGRLSFGGIGAPAPVHATARGNVGSRAYWLSAWSRDAGVNSVAGTDMARSIPGTAEGRALIYPGLDQQKERDSRIGRERGFPPDERRRRPWLAETLDREAFAAQQV